MSADPRQKVGTAVPTDPITGEKKRKRSEAFGGSGEPEISTGVLPEPGFTTAATTDTSWGFSPLFKLRRHFEEEHGGYYVRGRFVNPDSYDKLLLAHDLGYPNCRLT